MTVVRDTTTPALASIIDALSSSYTIVATVGDPQTEVKMASMDAHERPFLRATEALQAAAITAANPVLQAQLRAATPNMGAVFQALGEGAWTHILLRFRGGKRDVTMRALTKRWRDRKVAAGKSPLIGHGLTGDLVTDLSNATVRVFRQAR